MQPDAKILAEFGVSNPVFISRSGWASVWRVERSDGTPAALKIYTRDNMGSEAHGINLIQHLNGQTASYIYQKNENTVLLEWLEGPSLGDLTRNGDDNTACYELGKVTKQLHAQLRTINIDLIDLDDWFSGLFNLNFSSDSRTHTQSALKECKTLAKNLLATQKNLQPLHGDLHHDNVRMGTRGYSAFDAKGILGEPAYELANAFRNPKGAPDIVNSPKRITRCADMWSEALSISRKRLLQWATVKCALSIAWRAKGTFTQDDEEGLLVLLLNASKEA